LFPSHDQYGSASRFFYCAKASKKDRNEGLEDFEEKSTGQRIKAQSAGRKDAGKQVSSFPQANNHPTVKPTDLMRYLVRLVTPKNGIVLDCFMGSGSTGKACALEGFEFVGIDLDKDYCEIAKARIDKALEDKKQDEAQTELF
jgi:site-specific DNA-methyltransferase (adenine-specific)